MEFLEILKLSISNLKSYKMRTLLTMLGIIVGIASVVLISSLGEGFQNKLLSDISTTYENTLNISVNNNKYNTLNENEYFTKDDLVNIKMANHVIAASFNIFMAMKEKSTETFTALSGIYNVDAKIIEKPNLIVGRWFTEKEINSYEEIAVIEKNAAIKLYGDVNNAIGKKIILTDFQNEAQQLTLTVIGVVKSNADFINNIGDSLGGSRFEVSVPNNLIKSIIGNKETYEALSVEIDNKDNILNAKNEITNILKLKTDKEDLYEIKLFSENVKVITNILDKISGFISLIAAISIIVSGIGVMNIMLVSVKERITEIGLRKAIGARNKDILVQFLIETIILTIIGGLIGISIGYAISLLVGLFINILPILKLRIVIIMLSISAITGLVFGIYPAKQASKLSPIEALRNE